jgi:hypothetical protein
MFKPSERPILRIFSANDWNHPEYPPIPIQRPKRHQLFSEMWKNCVKQRISMNRTAMIGKIEPIRPTDYHSYSQFFPKDIK